MKGIWIVIDMKFHLLASGSKGNCFVLQEGNRTIVIDCGSTKKHLVSSFHDVNINIDDVDLVLLTHNHTDHIKQLKLFENSLIYSPVFLEERKDARILRPRSYFTIDQTIKVTSIPLSHDADVTLGFIIENKKEKLVYITDTGYIKDEYTELLYGADYIIIESNHDVGMLMKCNRPYYIKSRIQGEYGHLNNEDCANTLEKIVSSNTKEIVLAHISQDANTYEKALEVSVNHLLKYKKDELNNDLRIVAAKQFEIVSGGIDYEKVNDIDSLPITCMEWVYDI